ncbi:MAG TPA: hypothetical protein DEQ47_16425 [Solibacterales bacterium]|nr:hypothetical protein [Bryobacterales bacterium]
MRQWLREAGRQHVLMESTGSYGKPIFNVLEEQMSYPLAFRIKSQIWRSSMNAKDNASFGITSAAWVGGAAEGVQVVGGRRNIVGP